MEVVCLRSKWTSNKLQIHTHMARNFCSRANCLGQPSKPPIQDSHPCTAKAILAVRLRGRGVGFLAWFSAGLATSPASLACLLTLIGRQLGVAGWFARGGLGWLGSS